jgi:hypothetical protein
MRNLLTFFCLSAALFSSTAFSFHPVDGWWYDPNESGRGFNIELQDDEMFISAFHYRENGEPVWWVANGRFNASTGRMRGEFLELENGQCPGCPYTGFPDIVEGAGSAVTVDFDTAISATLNWDGETIRLVRQFWRFDTSDLNSFLFGEFHVTPGALGTYFGQQFYIDDSFVGDDGENYVSGRIRGGSSSRLAVGRWYPDSGIFIVLIDSSPSYYQALAFDMTKDRLEGDSEVYEKDEDPTGSGLPFIGHRVASKSYVQTGVGPNSLSAAASPDEAMSELLMEQQQELHLELSRVYGDQPSPAPPASNLRMNGDNEGALVDKLRDVSALERELQSLAAIKK